MIGVNQMMMMRVREGEEVRVREGDVEGGR